MDYSMGYPQATAKAPKQRKQEAAGEIVTTDSNGLVIDIVPVEPCEKDKARKQRNKHTKGKAE